MAELSTSKIYGDLTVTRDSEVKRNLVIGGSLDVDGSLSIGASLSVGSSISAIDSISISNLKLSSTNGIEFFNESDVADLQVFRNDDGQLQIIGGVSVEEIMSESVDGQWRMVYGNNELSIELWDGSQWSQQGKIGLQDGGFESVYAYLKGLVSPGTDLSTFDIGIRAPDGAEVYSFNGDYLDKAGNDPFTTKTNIGFDNAIQVYGDSSLSHSGGSGSLMYPLAVNNSGDWVVNFWLRRGAYDPGALINQVVELDFSSVVAPDGLGFTVSYPTVVSPTLVASEDSVRFELVDPENFMFVEKAFSGAVQNYAIRGAGDGVWMAGAYEYAEVSTDNGVTWSRITVDTPAANYYMSVMDIIPFGGGEWLALMKNYSSIDDVEELKFYRTLNDGGTWSEEMTPIKTVQTRTNSIGFDGESTICIIFQDLDFWDDSFCMWSTDKGATWNRTSSSIGTPSYNEHRVNVDDNGVWYVGSYKSSDFVNWTQMTLTAENAASYPEAPYQLAYTASTGDGILIGSFFGDDGVDYHNRMATSVDGGVTWVLNDTYSGPAGDTIAGYKGNIRDVVRSGRFVAIAGYGGTGIIYSIDRGFTWNSLSFPSDQGDGFADQLGFDGKRSLAVCNYVGSTVMMVHGDYDFDEPIFVESSDYSNLAPAVTVADGTAGLEFVISALNKVEVTAGSPGAASVPIADSPIVSSVVESGNDPNIEPARVAEVGSDIVVTHHVEWAPVQVDSLALFVGGVYQDKIAIPSDGWSLVNLEHSPTGGVVLWVNTSELQAVTSPGGSTQDFTIMLDDYRDVHIDELLLNNGTIIPSEDLNRYYVTGIPWSEGVDYDKDLLLSAKPGGKVVIESPVSFSGGIDLDISGLDARSVIAPNPFPSILKTYGYDPLTADDELNGRITTINGAVNTQDYSYWTSLWNNHYMNHVDLLVQQNTIPDLSIDGLMIVEFPITPGENNVVWFKSAHSDNYIHAVGWLLDSSQSSIVKLLSHEVSNSDSGSYNGNILLPGPDGEPDKPERYWQWVGFPIAANDINTHKTANDTIFVAFHPGVNHQYADYFHMSGVASTTNPWGLKWMRHLQYGGWNHYNHPTPYDNYGAYEQTYMTEINPDQIKLLRIPVMDDAHGVYVNIIKHKPENFQGFTQWRVVGTEHYYTPRFAGAGRVARWIAETHGADTNSQAIQGFEVPLSVVKDYAQTDANGWMYIDFEIKNPSNIVEYAFAIFTEYSVEDEILTLKGEQGEKGNPGVAGVDGVDGATGATGGPGPAFQINAVGLDSEKSTYDAEAEGFVFYATDTQLLYQRLGAGWTPGISYGVPPGVVEENVFSNSNYITEPPTMVAGRNYMMIGPVEIADGVTIDIPDGAVLVVV